MLPNACPKPEPRSRAKAALARLQAKHDRGVYAEVTARDHGVCRVCGSPGERHHLRGRRFTTTSDVLLLCQICHGHTHVRVGGKRLRLHGDANAAVTVERRVGDRWEFWQWV